MVVHSSSLDWGPEQGFTQTNLVYLTCTDIGTGTFMNLGSRADFQGCILGPRPRPVCLPALNCCTYLYDLPSHFKMKEHATFIEPYAGLPLEIWSTVIRNLDTDDIPHAWFALRRVSKAMRDATELAFRTHYLREATIKFPLGSGPILSDAERRVVGYVKVDLFMALSHFSEDNARVHFGQSRTSPEQAEEWEENGLAAWQRKNWHKTVDGYGIPDGESGWFSHVVRPHLFMLRWLVNDNAFPDMQLDGEERTVSFLWRPFLNDFCGERLRVRELETEYVRQHGGSAPKGKPTGESVFRVWYGDPSFEPPAEAGLSVPEDFTWEHLVRRDRGERWNKEHFSDDRLPELKEEFPWMAHSRKIERMERVRRHLSDQLGPRPKAHMVAL